MKKTHILIHCSDSKWGDASIIDSWHKQRGWTGIGYNLVILNGYLKSSKKYISEKDGVIEKGRSLKKSGAHTLGFNGVNVGIGICLIGKDKFTIKQQLALIDLVLELMDIYNIPVENVLGHYETPQAGGKTCPCFDMDRFREMLEKKVCLNMKEFVEEL